MQGFPCIKLSLSSCKTPIFAGCYYFNIIAVNNMDMCQIYTVKINKYTIYIFKKVNIKNKRCRIFSILYYLADKRCFLVFGVSFSRSASQKNYKDFAGKTAYIQLLTRVTAFCK
jgi:hypothetical protein